jgi:hypothetical protein
MPAEWSLRWGRRAGGGVGGAAAAVAGCVGELRRALRGAQANRGGGSSPALRYAPAHCLTMVLNSAAAAAGPLPLPKRAMGEKKLMWE